MWLYTSCIFSADFWILSHLGKIVTRIQVLILISTLYFACPPAAGISFFVHGTWYFVQLSLLQHSSISVRNSILVPFSHFACPPRRVPRTWYLVLSTLYYSFPYNFFPTSSYLSPAVHCGFWDQFAIF
jgi:hypothetical protein